MVGEMLAGAEPSSMLDPDYEHLFQFTKESKEVLWCVGLIDNTTDIAGQSAVLGSMYWCQGDPGDGSGWAEIYWSQPLLDLFWRYPEDKRLTMLDQMHKSKTGAKMITDRFRQVMRTMRTTLTVILSSMRLQASGPALNTGSKVKPSAP